MWYASLLDSGLVPDAVLRAGIRRLLARRLEDERRGGAEQQARFRAALRASPVAVHTQEANAQHYEVPAAFYELVLGPHLKYSSGLWETGVADIGRAEARMLELTCARAQLAGGQRILELGCGWGSLTLWMAANYPDSRVTAVSNSASQRRFIEARARERGLDNVTVVTSDINAFEPEGRFDRIVSVEMLEHVRNYDALLARVASWLEDDGRLFVHVFTHREFAYPFEVDGDDDWMAQHFFTGGTMPSADLLPSFSEHIALEEQWAVSGVHYQRTAEAWLDNLDANRARVLALFEETYGAGEGKRWVERWRLFFMACAELWGYRGGSEWGVTHYRFAPARVLAAAGSGA